MADKQILIVGAGTMGGNYARMLSGGRVPGATLAGIVDIDIARADGVLGPGATPTYGVLDEALARLKPDAAYIATPDALHRDPVLVCARAGVAMLVEKPLATTAADGQAMVDAIAAAGVHAQVNYSNRWNPPYARAKQAIDAGDIGTVRSFNARLSNVIASPRDRLAWSGQTTSAWFLMSHCLDLAAWLGGRTALTAYASGSKGILSGLGIDTYDWIHAVIRFDDGSDGVFESVWVLPESWPAGIEFNFRILGSNGLIDVDTTNQNITLMGKRPEYPGTITWAVDRFGSFLDALDGRPATVVTFTEALHVTRMLVAIHKSLETGAVAQV
ncbi:MAG: Gfo/Idh/MocA family protein [Dehalococcoidia bacterium]